MTSTHEADAPPTSKSFRDPSGVVIRHGGRILRAMNPGGVADLEAFLQTRTARDAIASGKLVGSLRLPASEIPGGFLDTDYMLEHERIPFPSYPYEWPPEMLHAAGVLTLELAQHALEEGFGLKDATPYNVLFRGSHPVFVDLASFERRAAKDAVWLAYGQFARTFLLPLLASRQFGFPLQQTLGGQRDGLEPETLYRWTGPWRRMMPPFLSLVSLPNWLGGSKTAEMSLFRPKPAASAEKAQFVLKGLLKSCQRHLAALEPGASKSDHSKWSGYLDHKSLYTPAQIAQKEAFVVQALAVTKPRAVLDIGANEGYFSFLAAREGSSVVAIDSDPVVAGSIWRHASRANLNVLPIVVDLTRPTPATGWRNQECASFLDRARGGFDLVMMLAVVHHMLITERVPLEDLLALAGELTRDYLLIEFVAPEDPMFQRIARGREGLYSHLTNAWLEASATPRFELVRSMRIDGLHRWLYLFRRRRATG